jgi:hypothetical protein
MKIKISVSPSLKMIMVYLNIINQENPDFELGIG